MLPWQASDSRDGGRTFSEDGWREVVCGVHTLLLAVQALLHLSLAYGAAQCIVPCWSICRQRGLRSEVSATGDTESAEVSLVCVITTSIPLSFLPEWGQGATRWLLRRHCRSQGEWEQSHLWRSRPQPSLSTWKFSPWPNLHPISPCAEQTPEVDYIS